LLNLEAGLLIIPIAGERGKSLSTVVRESTEVPGDPIKELIKDTFLGMEFSLVLLRFANKDFLKIGTFLLLKTEVRLDFALLLEKLNNLVLLLFLKRSGVNLPLNEVIWAIFKFLNGVFELELILMLSIIFLFLLLEYFFLI